MTDGNYIAEANLGSALFAAGQKEEGLAHYREALRLHAPALAYHRQAAREAEERGEDAVAIQHYGKVLTLVPTDAGVRERLGGVLLRTGEYGRALAQFNEALRYEREAVQPRLGIARALVGLGRMAEARGLLEAVLQMEPANEEAGALLRSFPPGAD